MSDFEKPHTPGFSSPDSTPTVLIRDGVKPRRTARALLISLFALAFVLGAAYAAYRYGIHKGYHAGQKYERSLFSELPASGLVPIGINLSSERRKPALTGDTAEEKAVVALARDTWCFTTADCARVVWPMELLESSEAWPQPHFRVRQGVNRLSLPGQGLCEFVFALNSPANVTVYAHFRYTDECGNSLSCQIDGGRAAPLGKKNIFDTWLWDSSHGSFKLDGGFHRLTLQTRADGLEFDRIVVATREMTDSALSALERTPAPEFESLPIASQNLPIIDNVTACAMADHSLVIGAGHRNSLNVFVRLNQHDGVEGEIRVKEWVQGRAIPLFDEPFKLSADHRSQSFNWDLALRTLGTYYHPVGIDVFVQGRCVHSQQLNFIHPFSWAFLGPFDDPTEKGLYLPLEADKIIEELPARPQVAGAQWKIIEDGSCYDNFGVVDINKVYGRKNERWREDAPHSPGVVYAVTCIRAGENHHLMMAFAGDDCMRGWLNGKPLMQQNTQAPMETTRMVMGVNTESGTNAFVFKVSQTALYWQLLFEPDGSVPYAQPLTVWTCPVSHWR